MGEGERAMKEHVYLLYALAFVVYGTAGLIAYLALR